jgi:hypothetical protein
MFLVLQNFTIKNFGKSYHFFLFIIKNVMISQSGRQKHRHSLLIIKSIKILEIQLQFIIKTKKIIKSMQLALA